jgi:hypothetical protein
MDHGAQGRLVYAVWAFVAVVVRELCPDAAPLAVRGLVRLSDIEPARQADVRDVALRLFAAGLLAAQAVRHRRRAGGQRRVGPGSRAKATGRLNREVAFEASSQSRSVRGC